MENFIKVKHSYNAGDLIVLMAGLRQLHKIHGKKVIVYQVLDFPAFYYENAYSPIRDGAGQQVCMNRDMFDRLKPLIEYQDYIEAFEIFDGQEVEFDIDKTRDSRMVPMPAGVLHFYNFAIFPEMNCDMSEPWISCPEPNAKIRAYTINRTHRYTNAYINYFFLKEFQHKFDFIGTEQEKEDFCKQFKLELNHIKTNNFLELATKMKEYQGGIYNQSFLWHLADAMKLTRILELCTQFPNTFPTGANGYGFYHQMALLYYVKKMMNK